MIDLRHPLAVLAKRLPWREFETSLEQCWAWLQLKAGKRIEDLDLFGPVTSLPVVPSPMQGFRACLPG